MSQSSPHLRQRPTTRVEKVDDLVDRVLRGSIRIPVFQRPLRWKTEDVLHLFDSIYLGYPVGSLLFLKRQAAAARFELGPIEIEAQELPDAWWVVDGQQRITALTAALTRPDPFPVTPVDPWVVYFDARRETFERPDRDGEIPPHWVPVSKLFDSATLSEWVYEWELGQEKELRTVIFEAGKRLREYSLPLYVIETDDPEVPRKIFERVNTAGRQMEWIDVHRALYGTSESRPASLGDLAEELAGVGMGSIDQKRLLRCLLALRGLDVTQSPKKHFRESSEELRHAVQDAVPALRRVLSFLRADTEIPHLRLLPQPALLDVLTRFFHLHPEPNARTRILLTRWLWRVLFDGSRVSDATLRRRGVMELDAGDETSAQSLLALVESEEPKSIPFADRFDQRNAASRIALVALAALRPRNLESGEVFSIPELIESEIEASRGLRSLCGTEIEGARGAANRVFHPPGRSPSDLVRARVAKGVDDAALRSHLITPDVAEALAEGREAEALARRRVLLEEEIRKLGRRLAGWGRGDRPSIDFLMQEAGIAA